jgi:hypothetical protein
MPSTDDYRLQDILYRVCETTKQSSDSASVLGLGKYNHVRKAYMLDVDEEVVTSHNEMNVYDI